jgi:DNA-binding NarL/FixJ family response regulator
MPSSKVQTDEPGYVRRMARATAPRRLVDLIGVVERAYEYTAPLDSWLNALCEATLPLLDDGLGMLAYTFDASGKDLEFSRAVRVGGKEVYGTMAGTFAARLEGQKARGAYVSVPVVTTASMSAARIGVPWTIWKEVAPPEVGDCLAIMGRSPEGLGVMLQVPLQKRKKAAPATQRLWTMAAAHLTAGFRLRWHLAQGMSAAEPVAVLRPDGRCEHATPAAQAKDTREALRLAARAIDRARGQLRRESVEEAIALWKGLAAGRWSLVDRFDADGRRYLIALPNAPNVRDPRGLSEREAQVAAYAALGHTTKYVGYELGLGATTVSFHLKNAIKKLGLRDRAELVRSFSGT